MVDVAENAFVPLAIKNNLAGPDAKVLAKYEEPTWNNPVVRFFASDGGELLARKDRVWSERALIARTHAALEASKVEVPPYFELLAREYDDAPRETALFTMY